MGIDELNLENSIDDRRIGNGFKYIEASKFIRDKGSGRVEIGKRRWMAGQGKGESTMKQASQEFLVARQQSITCSVFKHVVTANRDVVPLISRRKSYHVLSILHRHDEPHSTYPSLAASSSANCRSSWFTNIEFPYPRDPIRCCLLLRYLHYCRSIHFEVNHSESIQSLRFQNIAEMANSMYIFCSEHPHLHPGLDCHVQR